MGLNHMKNCAVQSLTSFMLYMLRYLYDSLYSFTLLFSAAYYLLFAELIGVSCTSTRYAIYKRLEYEIRVTVVATLGARLRYSDWFKINSYRNQTSWLHAANSPLGFTRVDWMKNITPTSHWSVSDRFIFQSNASATFMKPFTDQNITRVKLDESPTSTTAIPKLNTININDPYTFPLFSNRIFFIATLPMAIPVTVGNSPNNSI